MKIIFLGRGQMASFILSHLIQSEVSIALVVIADDNNEVVGGSVDTLEKIAT